MTTTDPSQSAVALRPFNESDFESFAELLANLWHSESNSELSLLQGSEELSHHLSEATWGIVAEQSKPLGLCLVKLTSDLTLPTTAEGDANFGRVLDAEVWEKRHAAFVEQAQALDGASACPDPICAAEDVLMNRTLEDDGASVGILQLLVLSPEARGLGLGRRLMQAGLSLIKAAGASRYRLSTDEGCDWQFYEHIGLARIAEDTLMLPDDDADRAFSYFVYEGTL